MVQGPRFVAVIKLRVFNVTPTELDVTNVWIKNTALEGAVGGLAPRRP